MIRLPWPCRAARHVLLATVALSLAGCASLTGDCVAIGVYAVSVTVLDAQTGQSPGTATLLVTDGAFRQEGMAVTTDGRLTLVAAVEREGTYEVTVSAPGYRDWVQAGVTVTRGGHCNALRGVRLTARLTRAATTGQSAVLARGRAHHAS
ncbi:PEGA domain-containing protein [Roseisolibacter agri]|uniref:Heme-binding protein Shr-like Hb-interacting domain-containing protein n=1 Tax=Roseisolibacter agri TaxID=2014610 RepID=A0AA37Q3Z2_9BACT|nr:carboxypeptidase regulatory-like domain-containing protein [Roseisolibacter agri]GLC25944.1 hypothetical protein rosag_24570 [Roseisolibacter agri]